MPMCVLGAGTWPWRSFAMRPTTARKKIQPPGPAPSTPHALGHPYETTGLVRCFSRVVNLVFIGQEFIGHCVCLRWCPVRVKLVALFKSYRYIYIYLSIEGNLEVKLPTIWTDETQRWEEPEKRREDKRRRKNIKKRKSEKKEDPGARKGRKVAKHCVFQMICGSRGSKSRLAKAAGAEPCGQMRDEKLHAVVARSTFPSQNVRNTSAREHF